ncbi:hypothetical protein GCM10009864_51110 [Streptomyces lunalinharesii]|uniref:Uncharacterized protein n=1 Tax=Streptomyces lunalinharesii TaxID=333384 RepID=A0ABN3SE52_9ACTN
MILAVGGRARHWIAHREGRHLVSPCGSGVAGRGMSGDFDEKAFAAALTEVIHRHPVLRTARTDTELAGRRVRAGEPATDTPYQAGDRPPAHPGSPQPGLRCEGELRSALHL